MFISASLLLYTAGCLKSFGRGLVVRDPCASAEVVKRRVRIERVSIYLIGVNHEAQSSTDGIPQTDIQKEYVEVLKRVIREVGAECVAEEYSTETEERTKRFSLTSKVALENGAEHRFCDPHEDRRNQIRYLEQAHLHLKIVMRDGWNISNDEARAKSWALALGKYFERRELVWLEKIADIKDKRVIFVRGDAHVEGFIKRLEDAGWEVDVAARDIGTTEALQQDVALGLAYLSDHPEVLEEEWFE